MEFLELLSFVISVLCAFMRSHAHSHFFVLELGSLSKICAYSRSTSLLFIPFKFSSLRWSATHTAREMESELALSIFGIGYLVVLLCA